MIRLRSCVWAAACALLGCVVLPGIAAAHSPVSGIQGFYTGILHPFSTPPQALLMLGLGLMGGIFAVPLVRVLVAVFGGGVLVGIALGWAGWTEIDPATFGVAVAACALAALNSRRTFPLAVAVMVVGGACMGMQSVPDPGPLRDRIITLMGAVVGAGLGIVYILALLNVTRERFDHPAVGIGLRVLAAWAGAIALVMLALYFAPEQVAT